MINTNYKLSEAREWSDWDIIQKVLHEEQKALLEVLYDRHASNVFYKCLSIVKDRELSKDLSHDIMIKIFMNLSKFKGTSDFSFWVKSITYNHCMDYLKKKKRLKLNELDDQSFEVISTDEIELENKVLKDLQLDQLEALMAELKEEDKVILLMRYQDSMSVKLIAKTLKLSESAVKMRLKRSRDKLAELLKANLNET